MSIFAGTSEIKSIRAGTADVKAVYAGNEKVWPAEVQIPTAPNHNYSGRVIYTDGASGPTPPGSPYQTVTGSAINGCNIREHDIHLMIGACTGGTAVYEGVWETGYEGQKHQAISSTHILGPPQGHMFSSIGVAARDVTSSDHYIITKATNTYYAIDFLAYAWVIPHEALSNPDESTLMWKNTSSEGGNQDVVVEGGVPGAAGVMCAMTYQTGAGANYSGLLGKQGGSSKRGQYSISGGYKYFNFDARGEYIDPAPNSPGQITLRTFIFRNPNS